MLTRVGHYAPPALVVFLCLLIGYTIYPVGADTVYVPILGILLLVIIVFMWFAMHAHNRSLCLSCAVNVPLDAPRKASGYSRRFQVVHLFESRLIGGLYLLVVVATALVSSHPIGKWVWVGAQLSLIYLVLSMSTHRLLQPWCPHCRNGGTDIVERTPEPELTRT